MKLLNERNQVRDVAKRWRSHYGAGTYGADKRKRMVGDELAALNVETATAADVAEIVGNGSWVEKTACHECGGRTWDAVQVGEPPDYESSTATICGNCLRAALRLIDLQSTADGA
jgi:hypothetical protein